MAITWLTTLALVVSNASMAQRDTTMVLHRNGIEARFTFQIHDSGSEGIRLSSASAEWHRIMRILSNFVELEKAYDSLALSRSVSDSMFVVQREYYEKVVSNFNERIQNYAATNNDLISINQKMNETLAECTGLAKRQRKRNIKKSIVIGTFSTLIGILAGALVSY